MKKLSREKRSQLLAVSMGTVVVLAAIWFGIISAQRQKLSLLAERRAAATRKLDQIKLAIKNAAQIQAELNEKTQTLAKFEAGMASGDLYSWAISTIRQFKTTHLKVEIPQFSQIDGPKDVNLLPQFPYKQALLSIGGSAYFHDLGRFVAEFENQFPYIRLVNLNLESPMTQVVGDPEKLAFRMDLVMLVKPPAS